MVENLKKLIAGGRDSTLARFGLGNEYLRRGDAGEAAIHLAAAVAMDPAYSAAWKLLGKAHQASGDLPRAISAWEEGIAAAARRGDKQSMREMEVFLKRARRAQQGEAGAGGPALS